MGFYNSPQVAVLESDLSVSVPAVSTAIVGQVGIFNWGACFERTLVTQESELISMFGMPDDTVCEHWFSAWNYLQYAKQLIIVRACDATTAKNAGLKIYDKTSGTAPATNAQYIPNEDAVSTHTPSFTGEEKWHIQAKYVGAKGNYLKVAIANYTEWASAEYLSGELFSDIFDYAPADATEVAIVVIDNTNGDNKIVEKYIISLTVGAKNDSNENYYCQDYINTVSNYILLYNKIANTDVPDSVVATALLGGVNGNPSKGDIELGYDLFENKEEIDVTMIIDGGNTNSTIQGYIADNITENRKDCIGIFTVPKASCVNVATISTAVTNIVTYATTTLNKSSSWNSLYGNWKYQYDKYADKYRWIPISGDIAGITAMTHYNRDAWFAPAFYNRGIVKNCQKLAINLKQTYRDVLYKANVNPIITSPADGTVVLGQKTLLTASSAFNRLDVRWLFLVVEKAIATASKYFMGEKNTVYTRNQFKGLVVPFLRDIQGRQGIDDFYVQCDENVNTPEVIARNEFRASIYIRPTMTAEFIVLEFINVKQGVSFSEIIKKA